MEFASLKQKNLRVVIEPRIAREIEGQRVMGGIRGIFPNGLTIEFNDGTYATNDKKIIDAIKKHPYYGAKFVAVDEGAVEPTVQAVREQNETRAFQEEIASTCPECGDKFKTAQALNIHMRTHSQ